MSEMIVRYFFIATLLITNISAFSQEDTLRAGSGNNILDSLKNAGVIFNYNKNSPEIVLSNRQAIKFLQQKIQPEIWNDVRDPFRKALGQLLYEASHPPYDSAKYYLKSYPFDSLRVPWEKFYKWEPLKSKIPQISTPLNTIMADSVSQSDTSFKDTTIMIITDTLCEVTSSSSRFPFRYYNFPFQGDSIEVAVKTLIKYLEERDSTIVYITGVGNSVSQVWLNSKSDRMTRYWLKNEFLDSVTIWIGNISRDTLDIYLEQGITFRRPIKQKNFSEAKINIKPLDKSKLQEIKNIYIKPQYWKYRSESSFILSQAAMSNWVRGGESSISTSMDITGYADYINKRLKLSSNNFIRMKLGFLASGDNPIRKNLDLLETNSKLNHKAFGKFDFSGILLFKTQIARGYNYPNDSVPVSKFMNPSILTAGLGLDYQPNKFTSINFSPFSYKGTFVPDTAMIDQTKYGIPRGRRSLNEPGASFMITNEYKPVKNLSITNRLQLFTNYIHNPLNIDVDWEMIVQANLNWFTDVRFNTHLIFDDDTKTIELDKNKKPVLRTDGTVKKTARIQFKEILGFSFVFRF